MFSHKIITLSKGNIDSKEEALNYLSQQLISAGIVKESFANAVIERENIFPTGLPFHPFGVAIPHTDIEHVNVTQIAILTLKKPIIFKQMANAQIDVPVKMLFMLALKKPHEQLETLQKLIHLFQNKSVMAQMLLLEQTNDDVNKLLHLLHENDIY